MKLTHSPAEGTLFEGDPRPNQSVLKAAGFRWSRNLGAWYLPHSRDKAPKQWVINNVVEGFAALGIVVETEVSDESRSVAEREADRAERAEGRAEHYFERAETLAAKADAEHAKARQLADMIPFGQPILVGHHSERRDRNFRGKINSTFERSFATADEAGEAEYRAKGARGTQTRRESGPVTVRRIAKLKTEDRDIGRKLAGKSCPMAGVKLKDGYTRGERSCLTCGETIVYGDEPKVPEHFLPYAKPASGSYLERLETRRAEIAEEIAYWRSHLDSIGYVIASPEQFHKGQRVKYRHGIGTVVRVNKKTVTVRCGASGFELKYGYEEVTPLPDPEDI